jgi:phenylpyruvate tautomerase PptA (4-oxalocrotonate tautomerase family)
MPLIRVDLAAGKHNSCRQSIVDVIYRAMRETINVPENDRFAIVTEHPLENFVVDRTYLGIERTDASVIISITLNEGRTLEQKKAFFRAIADGLQREIQLRPQDVFINLVEVKKENWSFGNGEAQYAN